MGNLVDIVGEQGKAYLAGEEEPVIHSGNLELK